MESIIQGFQGALSLIFSGDREVYSIIGLSLVSPLFRCYFDVISLPMVLPLHEKVSAAARRRYGNKHSLMGLPPVIADFLYTFCCQGADPLGTWAYCTAQRP